jgi:hypothetical protein
MPGGDGTGPIGRGWGCRRPAYGYPAYGYGRGLRWRTDYPDEKAFLDEGAAIHRAGREDAAAGERSDKRKAE